MVVPEVPYLTIKYRVAEFKRGRTSCRDKHRSGRSNEVTTTEMVKKIHKVVLEDRLLKVRELAGIVGILKSVVHHILTENLELRKLCARWVTHLFTIEQKQRREDISIECLAMFHSNKADFSHRFITMDKTWMDHFTPETKKQSKQWTERGNWLQRWRRQFHFLARSCHQFLGCKGDNFHQSSSKRKKNQRRVLCKLITAFK